MTKKELKKAIKEIVYEMIHEETCVNCGNVVNEDLRNWFKTKWNCELFILPTILKQNWQKEETAAMRK